MSERTTPDRELLREGLRLVEREYQGACLLPAEDDPTWEARAWSAVAALVRRELEALAAGGDVRGRIIRSSILPVEDEETMIASLRSGAEAVERGELDVDDFVGIWSQYLRQLLRASSVHAPADARELAREIIRSLDMIARNYDSYEYGLPVMTHYDEMVDTVVALLRTPAAPADGSARGVLWDEVYEIVLDAMDEAHGPDGTLENAEMYADRILALLRTPRGETTTSTTRDEAMDTLTTLHADLGALLSDEDLTDEKLRRASETLLPQLYDALIPLVRTPRGEGDVKPLAWRVEYRGRTGGEWEYLNTYDLVEVAKEKVERMRRGGVRLEYRIVPLYPAAFRSEAQGEDGHDSVLRARQKIDEP